tara:strand:+ start:52 stop:573 length:522 start_codon:yes stop_codon:yes gene_type:complete
MTNQVNIAGQLYPASGLTLPDRGFRDDWLAPDADGIVLINWDSALPKYKTDMKTKVDSDAETYRLNFITAGDGMAMTYREKFEQAKSANAAGQVEVDALYAATGIATYPTLAASVGIEAATIWDVAQLVIGKAEAWADLSYLIEKSRLSGKAAIDAATTDVEVRAAYDAVTWG